MGDADEISTTSCKQQENALSGNQYERCLCICITDTCIHVKRYVTEKKLLNQEQQRQSVSLSIRKLGCFQGSEAGMSDAVVFQSDQSRLNDYKIIL